MADENNALDVLNQQVDPNFVLREENKSLRAKLAALETSNVVKGGFTGVAPQYQLNEAGFYDDTWFAAGTVLDYTGTPNMTMVPMNEPAKRAMRDHIECLENGARRVAMLKGRDYFGLVTDRNVLMDTARADAQTAANAPVPVIHMPLPHGQVPAMPHTDDARAAARRQPARDKAVLSSHGPTAARTGMDVGAPILAPAPAGSGLPPAVTGRMSG